MLSYSFNSQSVISLTISSSLGRWFEFFGGMGSSFIVIAEAITLVDKLLKPPEATYYLLGADYSIEAFLYLGNFGIALSVLDGPNVIWPQERATQMQK